MEKARYSSCMEHRAKAQKIAGITEAQQAGLSKGRRKGTNWRTGYQHRAESRQKCSESNRAYWTENPEAAIARGKRGSDHYKWKGGSTQLNKSIRTMTENRKWLDAVKARDRKCVRCGSIEGLEAHHKIGLADLIARHGIESRDSARACSALWNLDNGETLCGRCHYQEHGRIFAA